ncbi:hypothetical protein CTI12_AA369840 [Artemisia annua]|uniref:Uncharacterized protein n=1 Tax=Artemisia annua TaxID=35608 RepID=A0A2U1MKR8_ARTAN|nr:hypothetical protein CTI12_AA369840 [Artemisia annua]
MKEPDVVEEDIDEQVEEDDGIRFIETSNVEEDDIDEQVANDVHIDDIEEHQWVDPQLIDGDISITGNDGNTEMDNPMPRTDETADMRNNELFIKL